MVNASFSNICMSYLQLPYIFTLVYSDNTVSSNVGELTLANVALAALWVFFFKEECQTCTTLWSNVFELAVWSHIPSPSPSWDMVEPTTRKFASLQEELGFWKEQAELHQQRWPSPTHILLNPSAHTLSSCLFKTQTSSIGELRRKYNVCCHQGGRGTRGTAGVSTDESRLWSRTGSRAEAVRESEQGTAVGQRPTALGTGKHKGAKAWVKTSCGRYSADDNTFFLSVEINWHTAATT